MKFETRHRKRALKFPKGISKLPKTIKLISVMIFIYAIGWGLADAFMSIYIKEKLGTYSSVGLIIGLLPLMAILWDFIFGYISDFVSKKKIMAVALLSYLPFGYIVLSLKSFAHFTFFRMYHSIAASALWISAETQIRKDSPKKMAAESMGLFDVAWTIPMILCPVIGGLLISKYGWNIFYAVSAYAFLAFLVIVSLKIKKDRKRAKTSFKEGIKSFLDNTALLKIEVLAFFLTFSIVFILMIIPLLLFEMKANFVQIGIIYSCAALPHLLEPYFCKVADRKGRKPIILKGLFFGIFFFFAMFFIKNIAALFLFTLLLAVCFSAILSGLNGRLTDLMPRKIMGKMTGITGAVRDLGAALGPITAGFIADAFGLKYAFLLGTFIFIFLFIYIKMLEFK